VCYNLLSCFEILHIGLYATGICQRDINYYEYLNKATTQKAVVSVVQDFWDRNVKSSKNWEKTPDYIFDFLLTRDLSRGHILDFNPYAPRTDPLLFTYKELLEIFKEKDMTAGVHLSNEQPSSPQLPVFRAIDSPSHSAAASNKPAYQHNMVPFEALSLSSGRNIEEFAELWKDETQKSTVP